MIRYDRTIAAISTPPGKGGVAVIRVSGAEAAAIADRIFLPRNGKRPSALLPRTAVYGQILLDGAVIDDGILTLFRAPASFTGEDTAEIGCHGGVLVSARVLEACFAAGAIPAEPGEFTRRAFINGKMTLSEAEAIGDLLSAKTDAQLALSRSGASGVLSRKLSEIYEELRSLCAAVYVRVDYPEEDLSPMKDGELRDGIAHASDALDRLSDGYAGVRVITEGIPTVICGTPNTGKSSLYNALTHRDLAIVTDIAGTTRDTLTCDAALGKLLLRLSDTAGIRESTDAVEKLGVERTRQAMAEAELILCVFDRSRPLSAEDLALCRAVADSGTCAVALCNKSDLPSVWEPETLSPFFSHTVTVCANSGEGLASLSELLESLFFTDQMDLSHDPLLANARQAGCARRAREALSRADAALAAGMPEDMVAFSLEEAMHALGEIDGRDVTDDVISTIFSRFCVGK